MIIDKKVQLKKKKTKKCNIENRVIIKHLPMNQISALNNPLGVDMLLNKLNHLDKKNFNIVVKARIHHASHPVFNQHHNCPSRKKRFIL